MTATHALSVDPSNVEQLRAWDDQGVLLGPATWTIRAVAELST
jgi:uracil DNA glycosylase